MKRVAGRPRLAPVTSVLCVRLPSDVFDALAQRAIRDRIDLAALVRAVLRGFCNHNSRPQAQPSHPTSI